MGQKLLRFRILAAAGAVVGALVSLGWVLLDGHVLLGVLAGLAVAVGSAIPLFAVGGTPQGAFRDDPDLDTLMDEIDR